MGDSTLTILGCGNLGTAILRGILTAKPQKDLDESFTPPNKFIACVHRESSKKRVEEELGPYKGDKDVQVLAHDNAQGVEKADVIILACEPRGLEEVVAPIREKLSGKLLCSILAGKTVESIREVVQNDKCTVTRVLPNVSAAIGESMTPFTTDTGLSDKDKIMVNWVFKCVGEVVEVPSRLMDVCTAMAGSGTAFAALMLEAMATGGVAMGLPPRDAQVIAAQVMKGTAQQVLNGEHAAVLRDKVTTPGGCTIAGICAMEEAGIRGGVSRAIREATTVVGLLGRGVNQPNRTKLD